MLTDRRPLRFGARKPTPADSPERVLEQALHREGGFTLLEVLIAFAIAALALAALFSGAAGGLRATAVSAKYEEALSLAQSHLAAIGHGDGIAIQESSGADRDGFTWHLHIRKLGSRLLTLSETDRANDIPLTAATLYDVTATESWEDAGRSREITLATRRFATAPAAGP